MQGIRSYEILNNYGWVLANAEQFDKAIEMFDKAISIHPAPVSALINKAASLFENGELRELERVEETLVKIAPLDPTVFANIVFRQ